MNSCEAWSFSCLLNPHRIFQSGVLRLYFPVLESWVGGSISLRSYSSRFICMQMWDYPLYQLPLCPGLELLPCPSWSSCCHLTVSPLCPGCSSLPLLLVWMNVSSLTPWLSDFHTVRFCSSSGCIFVFKFVVVLLWLCKEAQYIYLCLHLGWKSNYHNFDDLRQQKFIPSQFWR